MDDTTVNNREGYLYLTGRRGYSAYEVAVQNGFVGTEEEWLESLKGESGTPFDELTPEQKEEIRGPQGKSAYEVAVDNGYIGTEEDWVNDFMTPDGYYNKDEVDEKDDNIIEEITKKNVADSIQLKNIKDLVYSGTDLYQGTKHNFLQGLCVVGNNIIFATYNPGKEDNYVRLVEYNLTNDSVVREKYLELNHANSITYDGDNTLYVAACNKVVTPGNITNDNTIFVVSYDNLEIIDSFIPNDLASTKRIRSVYYDKDNQVLYAGDSFEVFKIVDKAIVDSINLNTNNIDITVTNQTLKVHNNLIIGVFLTYIGFWSMEGDLIKIVNIEPNQNGANIGEIEDLDFLDDTFILGTAKRYSNVNRHNECVVSLYEGNVYYNINNLNRRLFVYETSSPVTIYVNNESTQTYEDGSVNYPFKNLQRAISIANNRSNKTLIMLSGSSYDNIFIANGAAIDLSIQNDVTIDGIEVNDSYLHIIHNSHILTINGMRLYNSKFIFKADSTNKSIININNNEDNTLYYQKALLTLNSILDIEYLIFNLSDMSEAVSIGQQSYASVRSCIFNDYENEYALIVNYNSIVNLFSCTFSETLSSTQHSVKVTTGALVNVTNNMLNKNNYTLSSNGKVFPSKGKVVLDSDVYFGDICDVDDNYNVAVLKVKVPSLNTSCKYMMIHLADTGTTTVMDAMWISGNKTYLGLIAVAQQNGKLTITHNKLTTFENGTQTNEELNTNTPDTKWLCVKDVTYYII